jgi:intraflagellar transport protein 57
VFFNLLLRHYFVHSTNIGEQFHLFTSLCTWLICKADIISDNIEMPHEFEDPNATISKILNSIKNEKVVFLIFIN